LYELKVDTDGDAIADIAYRVRFSSSEDASQTATLRRVEGAQAAGRGDDGQVIVEAAGLNWSETIVAYVWGAARARDDRPARGGGAEA
jgi:hypothetical protein